MSQVLLDPTNESTPAVREPLARLDTLQGRTVGLLNISKARGDIFLTRLEERLREHGADVVQYAKPTFAKPAPVDLRQEIATRCDAVIEALAD